MTDFPKKDVEARRAKARALLPASPRKLPWMEYRQRPAETSEEDLSDVEFGVEGSRELHRRFSKRFPPAS